MASKFDVMETQQLQYQIDIVEENIQHLVATRDRGRKSGNRNVHNDGEMCSFYEQNYRTLSSLCAQYERKIKLLESLNQKRMQIENNESQQSGIRMGLVYGGLVSVALFVPFSLFVL